MITNDSIKRTLWVTALVLAVASLSAGPAAAVDRPPPRAEADHQQLVADNTRFAFDLYQTLRSREGNLFFSPFSLSEVLAMTLAGTAGETERQMQETLRFTLPQDRVRATSISWPPFSARSRSTMAPPRSRSTFAATRRRRAEASTAG